MSILRDLVARVTFKTDTTELVKLDNTLGIVKRGIAGIAATALSGWAIKAGGDVDFLNQQLGVRLGGGLDTIKAKIEELATGKGGELASIFSREDLIRGSLALARLGFSGQDAASLLETASTLILRSGKGIAETADELGNALQKGGITELLRSYGFLAREVSEDFQLVEEAIRAGAGIYGPRAARLAREGFANILGANRELLKKEREQLQISAAGTNMRIGAQMENLWNRIALTITEAMAGPLNTVAEMLKKATGFVEGFRKEIEKAGGVTEAFFNRMNKLFPEHTETVSLARKAWEGLTEFVGGLFDNPVSASLSVGAVAMFMLTRNPSWLLGGIAGASLLGMIKGQWDEVESFLSRDALGAIAGATVGGVMMALATGNPIWILAGAAAGGMAGKNVAGIMGETVDAIPDTTTSRFMLGRVPGVEAGDVPLPPGELGIITAIMRLLREKPLAHEAAQGNVTVTVGDIIISGAQSPEDTSKAVLGGILGIDYLRAATDIIPRLEN